MQVYIDRWMCGCGCVDVCGGGLEGDRVRIRHSEGAHRGRARHEACPAAVENAIILCVGFVCESVRERDVSVKMPNHLMVH